MVFESHLCVSCVSGTSSVLFIQHLKDIVLFSEFEVFIYFYKLQFSVHVEVRGQHIGVVLPPLPCKFQGPSSNFQTWLHSHNQSHLSRPHL